jgi:hypothetical protein
MIFIWLFFFLLVQFFGVSSGFIQDIHYESTGAFFDANIHAFGLAEGGLIDVKYNISTHNTVDDPSTSFLLFLVVIQDQYDSWYATRNSRIDYEADTYFVDVQELCVMPSMFRKRLYPSAGSFQHYVAGTDQYDVLIVQCFPQQTPLYADMTVELLNPTSEGCCTGHLAIETVMAINIALVEIILYSVMLVSFVSIMLTAEADAVKPMHYLMVVTVVISVISSSMDYIGNSIQNDNGRMDPGLKAAVYIFHFLETLSFKFTVLLLGMGWDFVCQNIAFHERIAVAALFALFFAIGLSQLPCVGKDLDSLSSGCQALNLVEYVLAGLILLSTIIAMNYSVSQLRAIISNLNWYPSMPVLYARLKQFNQFRNVFLALLVVPTVMYMVEITVLTWRQKWVGDLGQALVKMVFICYTGAIFIPLDNTFLNRSFNGSFNSN